MSAIAIEEELLNAMALVEQGRGEAVGAVRRFAGLRSGVDDDQIAQRRLRRVGHYSRPVNAAMRLSR